MSLPMYVFPKDQESDLPPDILPFPPQTPRNPTFPKLPFPRTMRKLKSEMCRRPGLVPKKQRLESVGLGDGEGMGEEEGPIRTRCEKGEDPEAVRPQTGIRRCPQERQHPRMKGMGRDREKKKVASVPPPLGLRTYTDFPQPRGLII